MLGLSSDLYLETTVCEGATVLLSISLGWNEDGDWMCIWMQGLRNVKSVQQVNA